MMTETRFTPGPWEYGEDQRDRRRVFAGDREIVRALSSHGRRRLPKDEREANAHLIAAAPELYEQLAGLRAFMEIVCDKLGIDPAETSIEVMRGPEGAVVASAPMSVLFARTDAVLAKARGEQP